MAVDSALFEEKRQLVRDPQGRRFLDLHFELDRRTNEYRRMSDQRHDDLRARVARAEADIEDLALTHHKNHIELMAAIHTADSRVIAWIESQQVTRLQSIGILGLALLQLWLIIMALMHR